jgi:molybdopterin/thiamine biosynthesis adenylyltransferase
MDKRYERNIPSISEEEQAMLAEKRVLVAGCGGLGGYLIEYLSRMGIGHITAVDGDVFESSNLNRQILSSQPSLGQNKAAVAARHAGSINPAITVYPVEAFLDASNAESLTRGQDLVLDALDNIPSRLLLENACAQQNVFLVHGAIQGWSAQVTVVPPGSGVLHRLYGAAKAPQSKTSLPFTPALCAAVQTAEAVKLLCTQTSELIGQLLLVDLKSMDWELLPLN